MKLDWTHVSGFGVSAWQHDEGLPKMPFSIDHHEKQSELILHHHKTRLHPEHQIHGNFLHPNRKS